MFEYLLLFLALCVFGRLQRRKAHAMSAGPAHAAPF
jgi:hypothetical protein